MQKKIPVPITLSLSHSLNPCTCQSGKLSDKFILSYIVFSFILLSLLVTHIICHCCYHFPLQILPFRPNLSPVLMEHYIHHNFEKCRNQNAQDFEPLVFERAGVSDLCRGDLHHGRQILTWQYSLKSDLLDKQMESP